MAKDIIERIKGEDLFESISALLREDPQAAGAVALAFTQLINSVVKVLADLAESLEGLSPEHRAEILKNAWSELDGEALGRLANSRSRLVMSLSESDPGLVFESLSPAINEALQVIDSGKFRVRFATMAEWNTDLINEAVSGIFGNPVIFANLAHCIPPLINSALKVLAHLFEEHELPPEIMASALFSLLTSIDVDRVATLVNVSSRAINELHEGNMVLGRDEPYLRKLVNDYGSALVEGIDVDELGAALVALSEDAETVITSLSETILSDEELLRSGLSFFASTLNVYIRTLSTVLRTVSRIPPARLAVLADETYSEIDFVEAAQLLNVYAGLVDETMSANPDLMNRHLAEFLEALDIEQLVKASRLTTSAYKEALLADPFIAGRLDPEELGRSVESGVTAFNSYCDRNRSQVSLKLGETLAAVDPHQLEKAAENALSLVGDVLSRNPDLTKGLLKAVARGAWTIIKGMARGLMDIIAKV